MRSRPFLAPLLTALGLAWAGSASAIVVGGIDFGTTGLTSELETTTLAETLITGDNQNLSGYGVVTSVNGDNTYCTVDPNCQLFFYFTNYTSTNFSTTSVDFTGGQVFVYYDPNGQNHNLLDFSSPQNITYIQSQTAWADFTGHADASGSTLSADGTLTGGTVSFTGSGLLDVAVGSFGIPSVETFLDGNGAPDGNGGFADKVITTSGNNLVPNSHDTCNNLTGEFCIQGSADLRGLTNVVPEPASLALLGLGLAGLGFVGRRSRKSA
jgi:hypothetical protein